MPADAEPVEALEGQVTRPDAFDIQCAPLVEIIAITASGSESPDMREASVSATWAPAASARPRELPARLLRTRVRLEAFPEQSGTLTVVLSHPHGLPESSLTIEQEAALSQGKLLRIEAVWADAGGALRVRTAGPFAGARANAEGTPWRRIAAADGGVALLPSLQAGAWLVADCADASCANVSRERRALVEARKTIFVE